MTTLKLVEIVQRTTACTCGCSGKDPWHATKLQRTVRDVHKLPRPMKMAPQYSEFGYRPLIAKLGTYKHPEGKRTCGLEVYLVKGSYQEGQWVAVDPDKTVAVAFVEAFQALRRVMKPSFQGTV